MGVGVNMLALSLSPDLAASGNESTASEASAVEVDERDTFLGVLRELSDLSCSNLQLFEQHALLLLRGKALEPVGRKRRARIAAPRCIANELGSSCSRD